MKKLGIISIWMLTLVSCHGKKYPTIDLDVVNPDLKEIADQITSDFFTLGTSEIGLQEFRKKEYITPLVHRSLMVPNSAYSWTPWILKNHLGEVYNQQLFQVIDKGVIKTLKYHINCELRPEEQVEFRIDLNEQYKLAKIYLYLYDSKTHKVKNIFQDNP